MLEHILEWDKDLLVFFNSLHTPWLDPIMYFITNTWVWIPLYLFLIYFVIKEYKKDCWMILLGIAVTILLADRITAGFMKPFFERLRPSQEPSLQGILHLVNNYKGGLYGFASSHAANTIATATFFTLLFRKTKPWMAWLFVWAVVMTYTRLYLGVHYPGDILVGGLVGAGAGYTGFRFSKWLQAQKAKRATTPV